jgi:broad specificity phosphatase PhoE
MGITVLRHGAVEKRYQKRYLGHTDVDIDKSLFYMEKVEFLKNKKFDFIYCSELKRTAQTLKMIGFDAIKDARLNEVRFKNEVELKSFEELEKLDSYKKEYLNSFDSWYDFICAEKRDEFQKRVESFMKELPKGKEVLICTHWGVLRELSGKEMEYLESYEL